MQTFIASRWSGDNNFVFPIKLEIDDAKVTHYKGTITGFMSAIIDRKSIASVRVGPGLLFADIVIESIGGKEIVAKGFKKSDARAIMSILT